MNAQEIITREIENINDRAKRDRRRIKKLSPVFDYSSFNCGFAYVDTFSPTFEDYLELSALLPINNELDSYDFGRIKESNDCLVISHKVKGKNYHDTIYYRFKVGEPARTLELLTEGKCKIIEKTVEEKRHTYTALSCNV